MGGVTPLYGGSDAQIDYRLGVIQHACDSDASLGYRTDARERALVWIGEGLEAFEVEGLTAGAELIEAEFEWARNLIRGQHPTTGVQLVAPKVAVPAEAKLSLGPLVAAVTEVAQARAIAPGALFGGVAVARGWAVAERGVARRGGRAVARVDEAIALAEAAGLEPGEVWGVDRVEAARSALYETREVVDGAGERVLRADGTPKTEVVERRERVGIAGYDIGITVPKSLSVLLAMAPEEVVDRVEGIYSEAAARTFSWVEARTSYVKRGHHGDGHSARQERSSGLAGWVMTHRSARPVGDAPVGDPHWHVHITVANMAKAPDGTWLTVAAGGRELMRHAGAIDKLTQAQIRAELHREFGIEFARSESTGLWEVAGVPDRVCGLFSKRHTQVSDALAALGYDNTTASAAAARVLTRQSRSPKSETTGAPDTTLRAYWRAEAVAAGYDPAEWMPAVLAGYQAGVRVGTERANETMYARHGVTLDDVVARLVDLEVGLTAHTRRFSHVDALRATADALPYGASAAEVEALTELVLTHPVFVALPEPGALTGGVGERAQLAGSHQMVGGQLYTTTDVPACEQAILDAVAASRYELGAAVVAPAVLQMAVQVTEAAQGYELSGEQREVLERIVTTGRPVESLLGPAGTGKTTLMRAARVAWEAQGFVVAGAATAAVAAQGLAAESGIESRTVAQWLARIDAGPGLVGVDVLVLDEANLTDDRDRARLWAAARSAGVAQIVEVHDPKQHRSPGVGSMSAYIHAALDGPALTQNRRQRNEDERAALGLYREGRYHEALTRWADLGQVVATHTSDQAVAAMVATWMRLAQGAPDPHTRAAGLLMLAGTNEQVRRLNDAVQAVRVVEGQLGQGRTFCLPAGRETTFHTGDQVIIRLNDRYGHAVIGDPVLNGYRGVVTGVEAGGVEVAWRQPGDSGADPLRSAVCTPDYIAVGGVELGYCLTTHKAEGVTVGAGWDLPDGGRSDGSVLVWAPGLDNPGLYVATSRDRGQMWLFGALEELAGEREQLLYGTPTDQAELTDHVLAALAQRAAVTASTADDRPVIVDLGIAPTEVEHRVQHTAEHATGHTYSDQREQFQTEEAGHQGSDLAQPSHTEVGNPSDQREQPDHSRPMERHEHESVTEHDLADDDDPPARVVPTAEQRQEWERLRDEWVSAWRAGDDSEQAALWAEREAYARQLGPELAGALEREADEKAERQIQQLTERYAERDRVETRTRAQREARQRWEQRPHGTLSDRQLEAGILDAERARAASVTAAERARDQHTATAPAVAAGQGPKVTELNASLEEFRRMAGLHTAIEDLEQRLTAAHTQARTDRHQAATLYRNAEAAPWYRLGQRDQQRAQADRLAARAEHSEAASTELRRQLDQLREQPGGQRVHYATQARGWAQRAEHNYEREREQAQRLDEATLHRLERETATHTGAAGTTADRHTALTAEQQLRATMEPGQRLDELTWRTRWHTEQLRAEAEQAEIERQHRSASYSHDLHHEHDHGIDYGIEYDDSHGYDLGY